MLTGKIKFQERWLSARRNDFAVAAIIVGFFALFFWRAVFGGWILVTGDALTYSYPLRVVMWETIRQGALPLWTPLVLSGYPLLSMAQLGVGYPLTWGYLFLPAYLAEQVYVLAPYLLAPAFTYAYAREIGRSRAASLLAGLAFAYGGMMASGLAHAGFMTNAVMWLPLVLIAIERAGKGNFALCLLGATGAFAMTILCGIGQGMVFVCSVALAYALFTVITAEAAEGGRDRKWRAWRRWRPLAVAVGGVALAAGLAAFQILETMRAVRRSVRSRLTYEVFSEGSYNFTDAARSVIAPLHHAIDVSAYVAPLALLLAAVAVFVFMTKRGDKRVLFWIIIAFVAWALMLGSNTPFYRLVYQTPIFNGFRVPSRHAFEWTFAASVLAAYGWDALIRRDLSKRLNGATFAAHKRMPILIGALCLALSVVVAVVWRQAVGREASSAASPFTGLPESSYVLWKILFTLLIVIALWQFRQIASTPWRTGLFAGLIALACFVEPFIALHRQWAHSEITAARFAYRSASLRFLQNFPPNQNRIYSRTGLFFEHYRNEPRAEPPNLPALYGLHNVAGYEPLILERYSRALGGVGFDSLTPRAGFPPNQTLFEPQSHVLDILNTTFVVAFARTTENEAFVERDGVRFARHDAALGLRPGGSVTLNVENANADTLALVTSLAYAAAVPHETPVARLRLTTVDGRVIERLLRAGIDTAEWAHERADVRAAVRHGLAPIFDSTLHNGEDFPSLRFWSRTPLDETARIKRIEITNLTQSASLALWKATLYDSRAAHSTPLLTETANLPGTGAPHWAKVFDENGVIVLRNERALPRAWLVAQAEAVDGEEALRRIRGESARDFDPRRTALLEVPPHELPALPGGSVPEGAEARFVTYEANRLLIETVAETATVLVVSEMNYPGWEARVDGVSAPIHATNFILRGVALPAGRHRVEMRYMAPAARNGAAISLFTIFLLCGVSVGARRSRRTSR